MREEEWKKRCVGERGMGKTNRTGEDGRERGRKDKGRGTGGETR